MHVNVKLLSLPGEINLLKSILFYIIFYRTLYQTMKGYILFSKVYRVFNHKMIQNIEWSKYRRIGIIQQGFSDHCGIKLENL